MSTADRIDAESQKDPERLEREIDQQRADIGNIVDALENKLSPGQVFDRVMHFGKGNGSELMQNLGAAIKAHPLPALLTSVGLVWLYASRNDAAPSGRTGYNGGRSTYLAATAMSTGREAADDSSTGADLKQRAQQLGDNLSDTWDQTTARVSELSDTMTDKLHSAGAQVSQKTQQATDALRQQGVRAKQSFTELLNDNPLALGAMGIALGAILGAALPITEQENQVLGKASDRVTDKAKDAMRSTVAQARDTVHEVTERDQNARTH
jgi:ElaB/YqjD/DUF883 family membrane-anchored ribosome-binding protein